MTDAPSSQSAEADGENLSQPEKSANEAEISDNIPEKVVESIETSTNISAIETTSLQSSESPSLPSKTIETCSTVLAPITPNVTVSNNNANSSPQISIELQLQKSKRDLESMVIKYARSEKENLTNQNKVIELEKKLKRAIKDNDQLANRIKILTNDKNQLTDLLNAKVAQLTVLEHKNQCLNNVQDARVKELEERIGQLEQTNQDLLKQIESYKSKEGELLDFTERLSSKNTMLQAELDKALEEVPKELFDQTMRENEELLQKNEELSGQVELLNESLRIDKEASDRLKREAELKHKKNLEEMQNEVKMMRRKHVIATKELMKEIKHLQLQLGKLDSNTHNILTAQ